MIEQPKFKMHELVKDKNYEKPFIIKGVDCFDGEYRYYPNMQSMCSLESDLELYKEPKKVTLYNYIYETCGVICETGYGSRLFETLEIRHHSKLLKTETKEIEIE